MDKMPNETDLRTQIDHLTVEFFTIIPATEIFFFFDIIDISRANF